MENVLNEIRQIGDVAKASYEVSISDLTITDDSATFLIGENDSFMMAMFSQSNEQDYDDHWYVSAKIENLFILLDVGSENFVPVEVNLENQYSFVIEALESLISADLTTEAKKKAEDDYWESLIDQHQSRDY